MKNIKNYFLLTRPLNVLISGLAMVVSAAILDSLEETRILGADCLNCNVIHCSGKRY